MQESMLYATSNCQVNKTKHLEWLEKAYDSKFSIITGNLIDSAEGAGGIDFDL